MYNLESVLENETHTILWDFEIHQSQGQKTKPSNY